MLASFPKLMDCALSKITKGRRQKASIILKCTWISIAELETVVQDFSIFVLLQFPLSCKATF